MKKIIKYWQVILLAIILVSSLGLRTYRLSEVPPSLSWDEAAVGYNAFTIANWGRDEWGKLFPLTFKSFGDDKNPVHFYMTAITVKLFGLSEFSTRVSASIFGVFNVLLMYFLGKRLFKSNIVGITSAFLLALSPYALQFSRFNHELNFALFFFLLGLQLFFYSIEKKSKFLVVSFISFGISILSYHSAKIVVPPLFALLTIMYFKNLLKIKKIFIISIGLFMILISSILVEPALLGMSRIQQTTIGDQEAVTTDLYKKTHNKNLGKLEIMFFHYIVHFSPNYLFISGDPISRHSTGVIGEFYKIEIVFMLIGLIGILIKRSRLTILLLSWILLAPLPVAPNGGLDNGGHAGRAMFLLGSLNLLSAYGFSTLLSIFKGRIIKIVILIVCLGSIIFQFVNYSKYYYQEYSIRYAIDWQYGMREIVKFVNDHNGYNSVYMTEMRSQPYIFFLYYLKTPLPEFLKTIAYNQSQSRPSSLVASFDKYHFSYWDPIESMPNSGVLYVVTPSQYDGLRYRIIFDVKKKITYPNGSDAYFIVSYP